MDNNNYDQYNSNIINVDEINGSDIKINPDFYIHLGLVKLSNTFDGEMIARDSFMKYRHIVEHLEVLADAAGLITEEYNKEIDDFKKTEEFKENNDQVVRMAVLSRQKLRLMMKKVFNQRSITDSLKA